MKPKYLKTAMAGRKEYFSGLDKKDQTRIQIPSLYRNSAIAILQVFWNKGFGTIDAFVPVVKFFSEKLPLGSWEPITRLINELWKSNLISERSKIEDVIARLQGENIVLFKDTRVPASFGLEVSDSEDYEFLNLELYLSQKKLNSKSSMSGLEVSGESMIGAGIFPKDLLIIENFPSLAKPQENDIVVARVERQITVKRYVPLEMGFVSLVAERATFVEPKVYKAKDVEILGIVQYVIHDPKNRH